MKTITLLFAIILSPALFFSCKNETKSTATTSLTNEKAENTIEETTVDITPISHATMVLQVNNTTMYVDPVGGADAFNNQPTPDVILITDIHGDHYNQETLDAVTMDDTQIIAPQAVVDKMPAEMQNRVTIVDNDQTITLEKAETIAITGIPMYNLREEALKFHTKGRGNGYVIESADQRIYISGDTEDIPEMRNLKNIDIAFVCMNLPYTMPVNAAADAVVDFAPLKVYPYHYRGTDGLSDVASFKTQVNKANPDIEVIQLDWYPEQE